MNEAETRAELIDPALKACGWGVVEGSRILREYHITAGKIQFGSGWWPLNQLDGMTRQIESLSQYELLSKFAGVLTDSRSFLSYSRHEYFRVCCATSSATTSSWAPAHGLRARVQHGGGHQLSQCPPLRRALRPLEITELERL